METGSKVVSTLGRVVGGEIVEIIEIDPDYFWVKIIDSKDAQPRSIHLNIENGPRILLGDVLWWCPVFEKADVCYWAPWEAVESGEKSDEVTFKKSKNDNVPRPIRSGIYRVIANKDNRQRRWKRYDF